MTNLQTILGRFQILLYSSLLVLIVFSSPNQNQYQVLGACSSCLLTLPFGISRTITNNSKQMMSHHPNHNNNIHQSTIISSSTTATTYHQALGSVSVLVSNGASKKTTKGAAATTKTIFTKWISSSNSIWMMISHGIMFRLLDTVVLPRIQTHLVSNTNGISYPHMSDWKYRKYHYRNENNKASMDINDDDDDDNNNGDTLDNNNDVKGKNSSEKFVSSSMVATIGIYKNFISPLLPPACRFLPTCSQYGVQAIEEFGPQKGLILTAWRILRCSPFGGRGYDPPRWPPVSYTYGSY